MSLIDTAETRSLARFLDFSVFRAGVIASNLANIDTPGYRTRDARDFGGQLAAAGGVLSDAVASDEAGSNGWTSKPKFFPVLRPGPGLNERPDGNNVNVERETILLAETQMRFNLGVEFLKQEFHMLSAAIHEGSGA